MIKKAMILAAGFGKRVNPLTLKLPKPLLKVGNETLLSNTIKFLEASGIEEIVINVHYLADQIIEYVNEKKFNLTIHIVKEKEKILDTGGGIFNAINYFKNEPFLVINPDTIWSPFYTKEIKKMEEFFFQSSKGECLLLVVNKKRSFDKNFEGDFDLKDNLISRNSKKLNYVYIGAQIINPVVFLYNKDKIFSINNIWDKLIVKNKLFGIESSLDFFHISTLDIYKKILNIK